MKNAFLNGDNIIAVLLVFMVAFEAIDFLENKDYNQIRKKEIDKRVKEIVETPLPSYLQTKSTIDTTYIAKK